MITEAKNPYRLLPDGSIEVRLSRGQVTIIDAEDLGIIADYRWRATPDGARWRAVAESPRPQGKRPIYMHRVLMAAVPGEDINHLDDDSLNNRRQNLRKASHQQVLFAAKKRSTFTSRYKGVCWVTRIGKWMAQINIGKCHHWLGNFDREGDAARAYDSAVRQLFGRFGCVNFPEPGEAGALRETQHHRRVTG